MFAIEIRQVSRAAKRAREGLVFAAMLIVTFVIHAASPVTTSTDSAWTFHVAASILREGNVNLDEYRPLMNLELDYRLRIIDGHIYYYYPTATPLLVAPAVALINAMLPLTHGTDFYSYLATHAPNARTADFEKIVASGIVALAAAVMYLIARRSLPVGSSIGIALIFAFATSMWSTASRALWQHGPSVLFLAAALYLFLSAPQKTWSVLAIGFILAFAYLIRPTNSLSFAFFGLYFWLNDRRRIWMFALGGLLVLVPYWVQNWITYGDIFPPYSYQLFERLATPIATVEALAGTLVSPNRGLLVFTPIFLFAIYGAYLTIARGGFGRTNLHLYILGILVSHWVMMSLFEDWGGAWSIGPRYFVDVIPYLTYFLIPMVASQAMLRPFWRYAFVAALAASILIQLHCSLSPYPFMWNGKPEALVEAPQRKWDWGDLQFLRGLCRADPPEGRAPACWMERVD
jgi:hypothetical protein